MIWHLHVSGKKFPLFIAVICNISLSNIARIGLVPASQGYLLPLDTLNINADLSNTVSEPNRLF